MLKVRKLFFLLLCTALWGPSRAWGAACNASTTGNWSAGGTSTGCTGVGGVPASGDTITINVSVVVTLNVNATVAGLTFTAPAAGQTNGIVHSGGTVLTVNGAVTFNQPSASITSGWMINAGSATVSGLITFAGGTNNANRISSITITTGELDAFGGMTFVAANSTSKQIVMSGGASQLKLIGALTAPANSSTLTAGNSGSIFNYMDPSAA